MVLEKNAAYKRKNNKYSQCMCIRKVQNKLQGNPPNGTCIEIPFSEAIDMILN